MHQGPHSFHSFWHCYGLPDECRDDVVSRTWSLWKSVTFWVNAIETMGALKIVELQKNHVESCWNATNSFDNLLTYPFYLLLYVDNTESFAWSSHPISPLPADSLTGPHLPSGPLGGASLRSVSCPLGRSTAAHGLRELNTWISWDFGTDTEADNVRYRGLP